MLQTLRSLVILLQLQIEYCTSCHRVILASYLVVRTCPMALSISIAVQEGASDGRPILDAAAGWMHGLAGWTGWMQPLKNITFSDMSGDKITEEKCFKPFDKA